MSEAQFLELIRRWHDDALTEEETALLREAMENEANRRQFADEALLWAVTGEQARTWRGAAELSASAAAASKPQMSEFWRELGNSLFSKWALGPCAALLATGALIFWQPARPARLRGVHGAVQVERAGRTYAAKEGFWLASGDRVITQAGASSTIVWEAEETRVELAAESTLALDALDGAKRLSLEAGALTAEVQKQPPSQPMLLHTPNAQCEVLGTHFELQAAPHNTRLRVDRGEVVLAPQGDSAAELVASLSEGTVDADGTVRVGPLPLAERLDSTLIAAWDLDGTLAGRTDVEAEILAEPVFDEGVTGKALRFGKRGVAHDPLRTQLTLPKGPWTFSCWVKVNADASSLMCLAANSASGYATEGFRFYLNRQELKDGKIVAVNDGSLHFNSGNGRFGLNAWTAPGAISFGSWHHVAVAVTPRSKEARIYVDGVEIERRKEIFGDVAQAGPLLIGAMSGTYSAPLQGLLDSPQVYARALTPEEVGHLAHAYSPP